MEVLLKLFGVTAWQFISNVPRIIVELPAYTGEGDIKGGNVCPLKRTKGNQLGFVYTISLRYMRKFYTFDGSWNIATIIGS